MLAVVSALAMPVAVAKDSGSQMLKCEMTAHVVWSPVPHWEGKITGGLIGDIAFWENPATFPGLTEHFNETFYITTSSGTVITGFDLGVYNLNMFRFRANGGITDSSAPDYAYLVGYGVHENGITTPFVMNGDVQGTATILLTPP